MSEAEYLIMLALKNKHLYRDVHIMYAQQNLARDAREQGP